MNILERAKKETLEILQSGKIPQDLLETIRKEEELRVSSDEPRCPHCECPIRASLQIIDMILERKETAVTDRSIVACMICSRILHAPDGSYVELPDEDYSLLSIETRQELARVHESLEKMRSYYYQIDGLIEQRIAEDAARQAKRQKKK